AGADTVDGGSGSDTVAGHGNFNGDTGNSSADPGDTIADDPSEIDETFTFFADWVEAVP
ncbi:MAG: hypothetical protein GXP27_03490, partial [Planctomycetes bacterium]|nr:hypothetical protein [Planctomycetota bacterium]